MSSNTFTASNGIEISKSNPGIVIGDVALHAGEVEALREFFRHEHDEKLGRWRWPEHPEYVVYSRGIAGICVASETTGQMMLVAHRSRADDWDSSEATYFGAARAYFDAHPEPKPWHNAGLGEMWEFRYQAVPESMVGFVTQRPGCARAFTGTEGDTWALDDPRIINAHRIYPESSDG